MKRYDKAKPGTVFITNSPWRRDVLHPIIVNLSDLIDAGWVHTRQSAPYLARLRQIVSVGRVRWIKDSPFTGKNDCACISLICRGPTRPP